MNKGRGENDEFMVYPGDRVSIPGNRNDGMSSSKSATSSTRTTANNTGSNPSNSSTNLVMQEEIANASTFYGDFSTSVSKTLERNPNARSTVTVNADMQLQSVSIRNGISYVTVSPNRVTWGDIGYIGFNTKQQLIIGVSTPTIRGNSYSAEMRMNPKQVINTVLTVGSAVILRRYVPPVFPKAPVPVF